MDEEEEKYIDLDDVLDAIDDDKYMDADIRLVPYVYPLYRITIGDSDDYVDIAGNDNGTIDADFYHEGVPLDGASFDKGDDVESVVDWVRDMFA